MALRTLVSTASRRTGARAFASPSSLPDYVIGAPEAVVTTTNTGLKIGCISKPGDTATITAWVDAGSRYETPETNGVAHLFETAALNSKAAEIAALGGQVSSYTSREFIVFEAKVLKENVGAATKLLGDMVSSQPSNVDAAKTTLLANLDAVKLNPEKVLMEHLHDAAYLDTIMGMSVMGTPETVSSLSAEDVNNFVKNNVTSGRTVVAAAGAFDANEFTKAATEAFGKVTNSTTEPSMQPAMFTGSDKRMRFDSKPSAHIAMVYNGVSHNSPDVIPLALMEAYLGEIDARNDTLLSKNATSWLKSDQAPNYSQPGAGGPNTLKIINQSYKDGGLFGIYYEAFDNHVEESMYFNCYNLVRLVHHSTEDDIEYAKTQLKNKLTNKLSSTTGLAKNLAQNLSCHGRSISMKEMFERIDAVTLSEFKACADKVINDKDHALAAAGPIHELPDYNWIRRRSYWLRY
jgi:processing peptidase subunit beta